MEDHHIYIKKYGYKDVRDKWSKQSTQYDKEKNREIWANTSLNKQRSDLNFIIIILNDTTYKYKKVEHISKIYKEYDILSNDNLKKITSKINVKHLDKSIYENGMEPAPLDMSWI